MSKGIAHQLIVLLLAVFAFSLGCSSGGNNTNPILPDENQQSVNLSAGNQTVSSVDNHYLLAYNMIYVDPTDPDNPTFEVVPVRATSIHLNILKLLEVGPCTNCFKITGCTKLAPLDFNIDIEITHPISDMTYTVFDTRSIIMLNGAHSFPASGLLLSDNTMGDTEFMDPDGYTALFNA
ncbi:MAG: hypothetical protein NTY09_04870, partial [bacterium]|nr:hypothetical protein [bacterium]